MKIGKYGKQGDVKVAADQAPPTPAKAVVSALESALEKDVKDSESVVDKALTYEELLKKEGIGEEEAYAIRDALLVDLYYAETVALTPTTSVKFRTRSYHDVTRLHQAIERANLRYDPERYDEVTLRYTLAASLEAYAGRVFEFPPTTDIAATEKAFEERHKFVLSLPGHVVEVLVRHLNKFDRKLRIILSEGAVEDF